MMTQQKYFIVTATAPVNIAVIKYWGKRDEHLILPLNDSISFTLSQTQLCATTTASISPAYTHDAFWLNGKEESVENPRIQNCLKEIRSRGKKRALDGSSIAGGSGGEDRVSWRVHICSTNNFPTAAGLASSAAGYAAMVVAVAEVYGVRSSMELSVAARQGSGSACRSVLGGLVRWYKGKLADGSDSVSRQIAPVDHWPDLHVILCVACGRRKKTSSTEGMRRCVKTSRFMQYRLTHLVEPRIHCIMQAIEEKDWSRFCDLTMSDSDEMHAACLTATPPCMYLTDVSHAIIGLVHEYNAAMVADGRSEAKICYTFDAGPNACLFVPGVALGQVTSLLLRVLPPPEHCTLDSFMRGLPSPMPLLTPQLETVATDLYNEYHSTNSPPGIKLQYMLHTTVGDGPRILATDSHNSVSSSNNNTTTATSINSEVSNSAKNPPTVASTNAKGSSGNVVPKPCHLLDPITGNPVYSPPVS